MTSCTNTGTVENSTATAITVAEAKTYHGRAGVEFVDPRPAEAIAATTGKIPGARLVSIEDIEALNLPPVFADKTLRVVTTCMAGPMAQRAAAAFAKAGFGRVNWIDGGTTAWLEAGYPTVR
ncbi:rhodanese-like domain-containing protein [Oceanibium sediminis]|uniref:rhodanese-like domain-containing protein n=1 Tax=Oceanibium sediminis TaxID=2026339 RepID=UPI001300B0A9|nr:rhodanese-like domain-containing protein [Oceanibium sediminis]